ncbi:hypothetical protein AB205_0194720 [Aquarana catesbeiana]|uniref:C2H2-type domain-containing protein n=1 Tax=Aquarana catesbeiana TaxID=8400 RepID=A0A2G9QI88_AQUCT|nr:hypothetical protein AB205_0194720 [Aquarana catesbeiana]PIO15349.1 hypothetical protein AB205_0194720 [Aquarana catesbeiana]
MSMEERSSTTGRILQLTLEIIHLLTGEKCAVVKMVSIEGLLQGMYPSGEWSRCTTMDPPPPSLTPERDNDKKILEVTQKIAELLTGEALSEECRSVRKNVTMENQKTLRSPDLSGRAEMPQTSSAVKEEAYHSKEQNLLEGGDIAVDYATVNVKEEKFLDGYCWTPRTLPLAKTTEDSPQNLNISEFERSPPISQMKEELGVYNFRADGGEGKWDSLEHHAQVDSMSLWDKDKGVTGNPIVFEDEFSEIAQPGAPYWPPSQSSGRCKQTFACSSGALQLQPAAQGSPSLLCSECGKCFDGREQLVRHQQIHMGPKPYTCQQCEKSFWMKSQLAVHQKIHAGDRPFPCTVCGKSFARRQVLENHMLTHSGERPYACLECGRCFSRNSLLVIHQRIHSGEKPYSCLECNRSFRHKTALVAHQRTHTGERPYHCLLCGKSYTHSSHLVVHQRSHSGEKPYLCLECGKSFSHKSVLVRHQQIHNVERP